jgi:hypothetical protein
MTTRGSGGEMGGWRLAFAPRVQQRFLTVPAVERRRGTAMMTPHRRVGVPPQVSASLKLSVQQLRSATNVSVRGESHAR